MQVQTDTRKFNISADSRRMRWLEHPGSPDYLYTPDYDIDGWHPVKRVGGPIIGIVNQYESRELLPHEASVIELFMQSFPSAQKLRDAGVLGFDDRVANRPSSDGNC